MSKPSVREQLAILVNIATIDASAREIDQQLEQIPKQNEAMRNTLIRLEHMLATERAQVAQAERLRDEQVQEVLQRNELLSRSKAKAAKARNGKEAEAAERETESLRRGIKEREDERDKLTAALEQVRTSLETHEKEFADLRTLYAQDEEKNHATLRELTEQRNAVVQGREELAKQIDASTFHRYEMLRERKGAGLAELVNSNCSGCSMAIPAQQVIVVQRADAFMQCPHCLRVLYHRSSLDAV